MLIMAAIVALTMALGGGAGAVMAAPKADDSQPNGNCGPHKNPPPGQYCVKGGGPPQVGPYGQLK
jgi:hypothetical protein